MVGVGCSAPISSTPSGARPISSWASRSAVAHRSASSGSWRPPGNEISPAWRRRPARRRVSTTGGAPASWRNSGTSTAALMRPWTSSAAASAGSSRTPSSRARRSARELSRERDALDPLVEHHLALERAVHRALGRDHTQALDLLVVHRVGEAHDEVEPRGTAALGGGVVTGDLDVADVPALALGVHLHRDGGARGQRRRQHLLGARARVLAALVGGLVDGELMVADPDRLAQAAGAGGGRLHAGLLGWCGRGWRFGPSAPMMTNPSGEGVEHQSSRD